MSDEILKEEKPTRADQYWEEKAIAQLNALGWRDLITGARIKELADYIRDQSLKKE